MGQISDFPCMTMGTVNDSKQEVCEQICVLEPSLCPHRHTGGDLAALGGI